MASIDVVFWRIIICGFVLIICIHGETKWVWNTNRTPEQTVSTGTNPSNPNFGEVNFGRDKLNKDKDSDRKSIFPESPSQESSPSMSSSPNGNSALPEGTIRIINNGQSEPRLIPGVANLVSNTLQTIGGGTGGGSGGGSSNGGGLLSIGSNLIGSIFQTVPQLAGSALQILLGRPSKGNSNSNSGTSGSSSRPAGASTLPAPAPAQIPILNPNGGSGTGNSPSSGTNSGNGGTGNCRCIPLSTCFLPNRPGGDCAGGNIKCCDASTRTRSVIEDESQKPSDSKPSSPIRDLRASDVRSGLLENIIRGGGDVVDDALDFLLYRYYTEDDKERLATRVFKSG